MGDEDSLARDLSALHPVARLDLVDQLSDLVRDVLRDEPRRVLGAVRDARLEQVSDRLDAARFGEAGGFEDHRQGAHPHDDAVTSPVEREGGVGDVRFGRRGAGCEEAGTDPLEQLVAAHVVSAKDHDALAAAGADPVLRQRHRRRGRRTGVVDLRVRSARADVLRETRVRDPEHFQQEAMVELVIRVGVGARHFLDERVLAGERRGEDHSGVIGERLRQRPTDGDLFTVRRRAEPRDERKSGVAQREQAGRERELTRTVHRLDEAFRDVELGEIEGAHLARELQHVVRLVDRHHLAAAVASLDEARDVLLDHRLARDGRDLADQVATLEQRVDRVIAEKAVGTGQAEGAAADHDVRSHSVRVFPSARRRGALLVAWLAGGLFGRGWRRVSGRRVRFERDPLADVAGEVVERWVRGEAEVVVLGETVVLTDGGHDLGLLHGVDAEVGLELEIRLDLVGVVTGLLAQHLDHHRQRIGVRRRRRRRDRCRRRDGHRLGFGRRRCGGVRLERHPLADVAGEVVEGRVLGEAEVVVFREAVVVADGGHDLGLLDGVDAEVGLELEVGLDLVGVVAGLLAQHLDHHGEGVGV